MKRSLRQDAERRGPETDLDVYQFSSGVCWRLPVPSAINKKTSVTPLSPTPTHPDSWYSISVAVGCEIGHLTPHTPTLSLLGVAVCCVFYAGRLSFLPFSTEEERQEKIHELWIFNDSSETNTFPSHSEINLHFKEPLTSKQRDLCGRIMAHFTPQ